MHEGVYYFKYKDEVLYSGKKSNFSFFANDTLNTADNHPSRKNLQAYVEKLYQDKLKRKPYLLKYLSKFEEKFHLHFDGEIKVRTKKEGDVLILEGAHNHTLVGEKINILTIREPKGYKNFMEIPNDVPFKANVEMRYSNRPILKNNTSSFFPKNWDIDRVKEEIAIVYDKMLQSGGNFKYQNNKFKHISTTSNFEILIEFDELGNLTSAYPVVK